MFESLNRPDPPAYGNHQNDADDNDDFDDDNDDADDDYVDDYGDADVGNLVGHPTNFRQSSPHGSQVTKAVSGLR